MSHQGSFLEKASTRKVLNRLEDDAASLIVLRDSFSIRTRCSLSSNFSKLSYTFRFDPEILGSKVYMRWSRDNMKRANMPHPARFSDVENSTVSTKERKRLLKQIRPNRNHQYRIPVLGLEDSGKIIMLQHLQAMQLSELELISFRSSILHNAIDAVMHVLEIMESQGLETIEYRQHIPVNSLQGPIKDVVDDGISRALVGLCHNVDLRRFTAQASLLRKQRRMLF